VPPNTKLQQCPINFTKTKPVFASGNPKVLAQSPSHTLYSDRGGNGSIGSGKDCHACAAYVVLRVIVTSVAQEANPDMQKTEVVNHPVVSLAVSTPISSSFLRLTLYRLCYEFGLTSDLWVPRPPPPTRPPLTPATNQPHTKNGYLFFFERILFDTHFFLDSELPSSGPVSATGHAEAAAEAADDYGFVDPPATSAAAAAVEAEPAIVRVKSDWKGRRVSLMNFDSQVISLRVSCDV
jgi:hypothetical protein